MLSIKEIKKACKFVDGFEGDFRQLCTDLKTTMYAYPLFLQRVKQGLNKRRTINYRIDTLGINLYIIDEIANQVISRHDPYYDNDEGLEQAIKYILGEMK